MNIELDKNTLSAIVVHTYRFSNDALDTMQTPKSVHGRPIEIEYIVSFFFLLALTFLGFVTCCQ